MRTLLTFIDLPSYLNLEARIFNQPAVLGQRQVCLPGRESLWNADNGFPSWFTRNAAGPNRINLGDGSR